MQPTRWCWRRRSTGRQNGWLLSISDISPTPPGRLGFMWRVHVTPGGRFGDMRRSNVALRLQPSILEEARRVSEAEGVALNQFINVAVAEKVSALRTEEYLRERGARGDVAKA